MSKISVAVATYNGGNYIKSQLESLLRQTRKPDEVIIRDDCSTDNTADIIKNFMEQNNLKNWRFSVNENNVGFSHNFYNSIKETTGDIVFLCDQDDVWHSDKLETMEKVFKENSDIKALASSFNLIDGDGKELPVKLSPQKSNNNIIKYKVKNKIEEISKDTVFNYNIAPGCTMAFAKDIRRIYLNHSDCGLVHDWEINMIAALFDGLYYLDVPTIDYRIHSNNTIGLGGIISSNHDVLPLNYEYRLKNAGKIYKYLWSFEKCYGEYLNSSKIHKSVAFAEKRYTALKEKSLVKILRLYKYMDSYKRSVTFKGRIADIICIFKFRSDDSVKI